MTYSYLVHIHIIKPIYLQVPHNGPLLIVVSEEDGALGEGIQYTQTVTVQIPEICLKQVGKFDFQNTNEACVVSKKIDISVWGYRDTK